MSAAREKVRGFIVSHFLSGRALKSDSEPLFTSGLIDSFGVLELIAFLEKEFNTTIDTQRHELSEFDSIELIMKLLAGLQVHAE